MFSTVACAYALRRHDNWDGGILVILRTALKRGCAALINWRVQQVVNLYLKSMSDCELQEIGLSRSQIEFAVGRTLA